VRSNSSTNKACLRKKTGNLDFCREKRQLNRQKYFLKFNFCHIGARLPLPQSARSAGLCAKSRRLSKTPGGKPLPCQRTQALQGKIEKQRIGQAQGGQARQGPCGQKTPCKPGRRAKPRARCLAKGNLSRWAGGRANLHATKKCGL
jgi:hypothetical protein